MKYILSTLLAFVFIVGCSSTPDDSDLRSAIDSGDMQEVRDTISSDGTYSLMQTVNGLNLMQYAKSKGGTKMAELVASTNLTQVDINYLVGKSFRSCMQTARGDNKEEYCECSLGKLYGEITYLDLIDNTSNLRRVMKSSAEECL